MDMWCFHSPKDNEHVFTNLQLQPTLRHLVLLYFQDNLRETEHQTHNYRPKEDLVVHFPAPLCLEEDETPVPIGPK